PVEASGPVEPSVPVSAPQPAPRASERPGSVRPAAGGGAGDDRTPERSRVLPAEISSHDAVHPLDTLPLPSVARRPSASRRSAAPARPRSAASATISLSSFSAAPPAARARRRAPRTAAAAPRKSVKTSLIVGLAVPGLFATAALPAYALGGDGSVADAKASLSGVAQSQSLSVSAEVAPVDLAADDYGTSNGSDQIAASAAGSGDTAGALDSYLNASDDGWWRPLPGPITSPYGPRNLICNAVGCSNSVHEGIDFGNDCGTPIRAVADGRVTFVGDAGGYGNRVILEHDDEDGQKLETVYGHLLSGSMSVQVGDEVSGGQIIAEVGATGVVSGCHLDLKIMLDGDTTDPDPFLVGKGVTV
ncbi:M23 family metallopeptidase, partial [Mycetocola reblochoni]